MNVDLETRLRRAASVLDDETIARMEAQHNVADLARPATSPRRRWMVGVAAAALLIAGAVADVQLAGRDDDHRIESPPTPPLRPGESILEEGWNVLPESPLSKRIAPLVLSIGNGLFVWGGSQPTATTSDESTTLETVTDGAVLDLSTGEWAPTAPPPFEAGGPYDGPTPEPITPTEPDLVPGPNPVGVVVGSKVLVLSESAGPNPDVVAALYDPDSNTWESLPAPPLETPVSPNALSAYDVAGKAVVLHSPPPGEDGLVRETRLAVFDPESAEWREGTASMEPLGFSRGVVVGDELIVAGLGGDGAPPVGGCAATFYRYSPSTDTWRTVLRPAEGGPQLGAMTWTGESLIIAASCLEAPRGSATTTLTAAWSIDPASGDATRIAAPPEDVSVPHGWWTGRAVATVGRSLPMFYTPSSDTWEVAPEQSQLSMRPVQRDWVLAGGGLVTWGGSTREGGVDASDMVNDGYAYVPPADLTGEPVDPPPSSDPTAQPAAWLEDGWNQLPQAPLDPMDRPHVVATETGVLVWGDPVGEQASRDDAGAFLDMATGEWTKTPVAPASSLGTDGDETSIAVGDEVIFLSEQNGELATFSYDTMTNTWDTIPAPPMHSPAPSVPESPIIWPGPDLGAFAVGDKAVFVRPVPIAVEADEVVQPTAVAIFDTTTRTWSEGSAPPDDLYSVWGTEAGDRIVVVGSTAPGERAMCRPSMYTYEPEADNWQRVPIEPQGMSAPVAGLAYTGAELFGATYTTCALPERSTDPAVQPHARLIDLDSGSSRFVLSPTPIASLHGSWTGRTVAVTDERGYPLFFDPTSDRWHQAPHNLEVEGLPGLGDGSRLRRNFVYASGAMVTWGPDTDGYAYVPPAAFTDENSTVATLPPSTTVPD